MRKKYLSALLFGALLFASAGTFTSCKDYDDDINNLQEQINTVVSDLNSLKSTVDQLGGYVTDVKIEDGKLLVTVDNNTITYDLPTAAEVDKTTVALDGQNLVVDGEVIGKVGDTVTVNEDGYLCVNGEATEIKAGKYAILENDADGVYTITLPNANGELQTIELAKASSAFTEIEILGYCTDGQLTNTDKNVISYNYTWVNALTDDLKKWNKEEGVKQVVEKQVLSTLSADNSALMIRLAPATFDASKLSFTLVNSLLEEAPVSLGTPEAYDKLLTRADIKNGIWTLSTSAQNNETYATANDYEANFTANGKSIAFALKESNGFTTNYDLTFTRNYGISLDAQVAKINNNTVTGSKTTERDNATLQGLASTVVNKVNVGEVNISFNNPIYDAHLHFDDATIQRWNITDIDGTKFTIGKRPDDITSANFQVNVHYVTLKGEVKNEWIPFTVAKSFAGETVIAGPDHTIQAKAADDKFSVSLDDMFTDLSNNAALWKADVVKATIELYQVGTAADGKDKKITIPSGTTFQIQDSKDTDVTAQNTADASKFVVNLAQNWPATDDDYALDKDYYALISFTDAAGDVLNTVKVPFGLNIPALSTFLVKQQGVFNGTNDGTAYIFGTSYRNTEQTDKLALQYDLTYAFVGGLKDLGTTTITFKTNGYIGGDANNSKGQLVSLLDNTKTTYVDRDANTEMAANKAALIALKGKNNDAYGQVFKIEVADAKYLGKYAYSETERKAESFTIKMLSPIKEGSISAADGSNTISIDATDNQKIVESKFLAKTYSTAGTQYKLFPSTATKDGSSIYDWIKYNAAGTITITPKDDRILKVVDIKNTVDGDNGYEGYVKVEPVNPAYDTTGDVTVTVNDVWGFNISQDITINIKR